jgi:hypothetical protein
VPPEVCFHAIYNYTNEDLYPISAARSLGTANLTECFNACLEEIRCTGFNYEGGEEPGCTLYQLDLWLKDEPEALSWIYRCDW